MDLRKFRLKAASRFVDFCREGRLGAARTVLNDKRIAPDADARSVLASSACPITNQTGLQAAAFMGHAHVVEFLCGQARSGKLVAFDVDQPCADPKKRATAVHYAARAGRRDVIKLLLAHGAGKHTLDAKGREPGECSWTLLFHVGYLFVIKSLTLWNGFFFSFKNTFLSGLGYRATARCRVPFQRSVL